MPMFRLRQFFDLHVTKEKHIAIKRKQIPSHMHWPVLLYEFFFAFSCRLNQSINNFFRKKGEIFLRVMENFSDNNRIP